MQPPTMVLCALALLASPSFAQTSSSPPGEEEEIKVVGKKTCRMETRIGSMMPRRVCRTKEQTKAEEFARRDALNRLDYLKQQQDLMMKRMMEGGGAQ